MGVLPVISRIHLYLALFLAPWMRVYAFSTVAMKHRHWFESCYRESGPAGVGIGNRVRPLFAGGHRAATSFHGIHDFIRAEPTGFAPRGAFRYQKENATWLHQ